MSILDFIGSKFEQHNKVVGKVECSGDEVTTIFLGLAKSVGMANPSTSMSAAKKGISIVHIDNKYILTLQMFEPPLQIIWNDPIPFNALREKLDMLAIENKKVGWVNTIDLSDGTKMLQLAVG